MWKVTEHNQRKFDSLFAMKLNLYCWRLMLYSLDSNTDRGVTYGISKKHFLMTSIIMIGMVIVIGYFL
jgi:hypothetical protein